jgi:hypothetical protein
MGVFAKPGLLAIASLSLLESQKHSAIDKV